MVTRTAFTMIELIFAIVIIAISVISLPMVSQIAARNVENSLLQEAIFAASTELNQVVSYYWDDNSMEGNSSLSRVVWTSNTDCNNDTKLRPGHINQPYHRRCNDNNATRPSTVFGPESGDLDDLDDVNTTSHTIFTSSSTSSDDYKDVYTSVSTISYATFGNVNASEQNIKRIRVTVSDSDDNNITQLDTFSSNIGEIDYYKRTY